MKFKETIAACVEDALKTCGYVGGQTPVVLEKPKLREHGDISTPVALSLARALRRNPMEIAENVARAAAFPADMVSAVEVVKPGYINLRLSSDLLVHNMLDAWREGDDYGTSDTGRGVKCQVEYVSANPTGPLVIVSARAAAVGSVIVNMLRKIGFAADGEYYVNDSGNQIQALGESLKFRVRERFNRLGVGEEIGAYPGEYLRMIASSVTETEAGNWDAEADGGIARYGRYAVDTLLATIQEDLAHFGVHFDNFFRESTLHPEGVEEAKRVIEEAGYTYTEDGALHFRTTEFGDEKDRVLVKGDGTPTYFLGDIAYHRTKLRRGYRWVLDLLGPDHHGHIPRMQAAARVLGAPPDWLETMVVGWVRLLEGSKPVSMSKRAGEIVLMRDLVEDVGPDVAKYFFLMRKPNSPLDFDLELARKQSDENPVFYVQYAHARIASVVRFANEKAVARSEGAVAVHKLASQEERDLMVHLLFFPYEVEAAALAREPHRLTVYARELATLFHQFYHAHRIVTDDRDLSDARLFLAEATQRVLKNALTLMGISAPSSM